MGIAQRSQQHSIAPDHNELILRLTADFTIRTINRRCARLFDASPAEMMDRSIDEVMNASQREDLHLRLARLDRQQPVQIVERSFQGLGENECWVQWKDLAVFDCDGQLTEYQVVGLDISERIHLERSLAEQRAFMQTVLDETGEGIAVSEVGGDFVIYNQGMEEITGYAIEETCGPDFWKKVLGESSSASAMCSIEKAARGERTQDQPFELQRQDGEQRSILLSVGHFEFRGRCLVLTTLRDITEHRRLERGLAHAQRMQSVGRLASGIAHEINTPIQFLGDNTEFLSEALEEFSTLIGRLAGLPANCSPEQLQEICSAARDKQTRELLEEAPEALDLLRQGVARITDVVRAMKNFSHPGDEEQSSVNMNEVIRASVTVARGQWKHLARLTLDLDEVLPAMLGYPVELNQMLLNLVVNAAEAIEDRRTAGDPLMGELLISSDVSEAGELHISVSDNGCGIPEQHRENLFEPFFTTKAVGRGTGQGLSLVYRVVVERHGGRLSLDTTPGQGTTFHVYLPIGS